ncbi:hypothetical protein [Staphylococcus xylosus]|uniref:hypothetical protein n=2 Tax=Staphylococcus xylosus TaxID=1288 RepID=UPI000D1D45C8|nr:hypothetical protein [Staphylococcus xylosus]PTI64917.1 hypothetical protein BU095_03585 [Staphylococcus xylosus]
MSILYAIPIITSLILGVTYIIISTSRDRFLKYTEVNQYFAIGKLLNFFIFIIITLMMILLISFELSDHYKVDLNNFLASKTNIFYYVTVVSFITFLLSMAYLGISTTDLKGKSVYYIKNYNKQNQTLYILQQHSGKYICTFDEMTNYNRVIIDKSTLDDLEMEVYFKSTIKNLDFTNLLNFYSKKIGTSLFILFMFFLLCLCILFIGGLFLINYSLEFGSNTLILTSIAISIITIVFLLMIYITNFKNIKSKNI